MSKFTFDLQRFTDVSTLEELQTALTSGGEIKLTADITGITETLNITQNVTLDLNGHNLKSNKTTDANHTFYTINVTAGTLTIKDDSDSENKGSIGNTGMTSGNYIGSVIYVASGASLNLTSGNIDATATWNGGVNNAGTLTMSGGSIKNGEMGVISRYGSAFTMSDGEIEAENSSSLAAVQIGNSGSSGTATFTMSGGSIKGKGSSSLGLYMLAGTTFNMTDGTIYSENYIGVNNNSGTFTMSGGTITAVGSEGATESATMGVNVYGGGTFTMSAGEINSTYGGGVLCGTSGGTATPTAGTFTMTGGTITANGTTGDAVGVYIVGDGSTFTMKNGTINAENQSCVSISGQNSEDYTDTNKKNSFVMNGGTLEGYNGVAMFEGATKFSMMNGSITSTGDSGAAVSVSDESSGSTIEISGGTVKATGESAMAVDNESEDTVDISGGTIKVTGDGSVAVFNNSSGTVNISGEDTTINGAVCNSSGEVNISEDSTINGFITNEEGGTVKVGSTNLEELTNMATVLIDGEEQSFLNDDNKNAYIEANCVAIIGTAGEDDAQYFTTLEAAVEAAKENNTITLLKDVKLNGTIIINKDNVNTNEYENSFIINKDITLDLDEYDLTITDTDDLDCVIQILSGILTITGEDSGTIKTTNTTELIEVLGPGDSEEDGEDNSDAYVSKLILKGGTLELSDIINEEDEENSIYANYAIYVESGGQAEIDGGTIKITAAEQAYGIFNGGKSTTTFTSGTIIANGTTYDNMGADDGVAAIKNSDGGTVTISQEAKITVTGKYAMGVYNTMSSENFESSVNITGGTIKVQGEDSRGVYNEDPDSEANISGGTITATAADGTTPTTAVSNKGGNVGISNDNSNTTINGSITNIPSETKTIEDEDTGEETTMTTEYTTGKISIKSNVNFTETADMGVAKIIVGDTTTYYSSLEAAFSAANESESNEITIEVLQNITTTLTSSLAINDGKTINLNLGEYTITTSYTEATWDDFEADRTSTYCVFDVQKGGMLNITADNEDKGGIINNGRRMFYLEAGGSLTMNHGTYDACSNYSDTTKAAGLIYLNYDAEGEGTRKALDSSTGEWKDESEVTSADVYLWTATNKGSITLNNVVADLDSYAIYSSGETFSGTDDNGKTVSIRYNTGYDISVTGGKYNSKNSKSLGNSVFAFSGNDISFKDVTINSNTDGGIYVYCNSTANIED